MNKIIQCCSDIDLESTHFKCFYLGVNWNVRYCKSCQQYYIRGMGLDIHHNGTPQEIMHRVKFDSKKGCWFVTKETLKGHVYANN